MEQPLQKTVRREPSKQKTYKSDWTPYGPDGEPSKLTHTGRYLKVWVGAKYEKFHQQLKQDDLAMQIDGSRYHVHHKDRDPKNNELANLEVMRGQEHLMEHAPYGGRPGGKKKRQWGAARR